MMGCNSDSNPTTSGAENTQDSSDAGTPDASQTPSDGTEAPSQSGDTTAPTEGTTDPVETVTTIVLADDATEVTGDGVFVEGNIIIIEKPGKYTVSGTLTNGQLRVEVTKEDKVEILFNGVSITNKTSAPFYSVSADKTVIELAEGTQNTLTDGDSYEFAPGEDEPNACLFAKDDLTIKGTGSLTVHANYNNGITSKNDLKLNGCTITVDAEKNGIRGNDSISIKDVTLQIHCGKDALKVTTEDDPAKGYFHMESGDITIAAGDDAIQSVTSLTIESGKVVHNVLGKPLNCDGEVSVAEGTVIAK